MKENWLSVVGTMFGGSTSSAALVKANRLFEVLSIDNPGTLPGEEGLWYINISQNIKMPAHDIFAQSIHATVGKIDNYDSLFNALNARFDNVIDILYQIIQEPTVPAAPPSS